MWAFAAGASGAPKPAPAKRTLPPFIPLGGVPLVPMGIEQKPAPAGAQAAPKPEAGDAAQAFVAAVRRGATDSELAPLAATLTPAQAEAVATILEAEGL